MSIKNWPEHERPREKLLHYGASSLSDAELLAILLRTGVPGYSAVDLARNLLNDFGSLSHLLNAEAEVLCQHRGMGMASYTQFAVIREISRRILAEEMREIPLLDCPERVVDYLRLHLGYEKIEICVALLLNQQNKLLQWIELSRGSVSENHISIRELAKYALQHHATAIILAHNHPGGGVEPSTEDIAVTQRIKSGLQLLDIQLLDHFIITQNQAISLHMMGLM